MTGKHDNEKEKARTIRAVGVIILLFLITAYIGFKHQNEVCIFVSGILFSAIIEYAYKGVKSDYD